MALAFASLSEGNCRKRMIIYTQARRAFSGLSIGPVDDRDNLRLLTARLTPQHSLIAQSGDEPAIAGRMGSRRLIDLIARKKPRQCRLLRRRQKRHLR